ncbi:MAG TPA: serine/threonine protein kinase [Pyrinomonadaceae bacterium]
MRELSLDNCRLDRRYDIVRSLGRGSYAEIFVAHDILASTTSPHRCVVIKALNVFLQNDLDPDLERTLVENFQNEAVALDRVRHPNIISRLGHGTARDLAGTVFHYLVLEYLEGGDLQKAARQGNLSFKQSFKYIEQVCAGLRHAHRHHIIHRDIKPQNLLLTKDHETVKIADFGVARLHHSDSPITRVGTNIYAPPEHSPLNFDGGGQMVVTALTPAADIYSLAKSVYTLITGEAPRAFANQQITDLPLTWRDKEWSDDLLRALKRATSSDPAARQQSVDDFWQELEPVRRIAYDMETLTSVRPKLHETPQPHVARGYSPLAPQQPKFDTSRELKLKHPFGPVPRVTEGSDPVTKTDYDTIREPGFGNSRPPLTRQGRDLEVAFGGRDSRPAEPPAYRPASRVESYWAEYQNRVPVTAEEALPQPAPKRRSRLRRIATFAVLLIIFAGGLYGTSAFLRSRGIIPTISNPFTERTGRANTDINLRPEPNANNEPIGLVTKNSKVRILRTQNNWYQVDVLEQGRERDIQLSTTRGWLNGKYVDVD